MNPLVRSNSLLTPDRLESIEGLVNQVKDIPGDTVEVGVYRGGTALLIAENTDKTLHLFDTFEGLPEVDKSVDLHHKGDFADTSIEHINNLLADKNFTLHKGLFPQETGKEIENLTFSFVNLDVDLYQDTKNCLEFFYPRLNKGAILVSDDYLMSSCPGVKKAFDEFMVGKPEKLITDCRFQCHFVKE